MLEAPVVADDGLHGGLGRSERWIEPGDMVTLAADGLGTSEIRVLE